MGLLENAAQAKQLHDEAEKAARVARNMAAWEAKLAAARSWWTEHIGEPAEFFYPAGESGASWREKGVVAVSDGWSFYISDQDHKRSSYDRPDGLHAYLIRRMEMHNQPTSDAPKPYHIELWKEDSYYSNPPQLDSLADIGRWLTLATAKGLEAPDPETLIWRKVKWN